MKDNTKDSRKNNITLIGMPAAGKSTVGVLLAKRLGYSFIDVDIVIQEEEGKLLKEIIKEQGLDGFMEVENRVNAGLRANRAVIAPGGSVIYGKEAMENLKSLGPVVYLKISYEELCSRLGDVVDRGVVLKEGMTLEELYNERVSYFERYADIIIDEEGEKGTAELAVCPLCTCAYSARYPRRAHVCKASRRVRCAVASQAHT